MNITQSNSTKQFSLTILVAITCLLLSLYFPASSPFEKITRSVFFLLVVPVFYIKTILKKDLSYFGFNLKNKTIGILGGIASFSGIIFYFYLSQKYPVLKTTVDVPPLAAINFFWFVFYELIFVGTILFCLEFFFRGFLLFSLETKFSFWTILVQTAFYSAINLFSNPSLGIFFQSAVIALSLGLLSLRTRSFLYSYGIMMLSSILIDAYAIYSIKQI